MEKEEQTDSPARPSGIPVPSSLVKSVSNLSASTISSVSKIPALRRSSKPTSPLSPNENDHKDNPQVNGGRGQRMTSPEPGSFRIGDTVWIDGLKKGRIAYIGDTQFSKGEWVGVCLEAPEGKNDGSVNGVRYFQCDGLHGTFTRPGRLRKQPNVPLDPERDCYYHGSSPSRCLVEKQRSPSPMSPAASPSPGSTRNTTPPPIAIGERVIVQSSMGSKCGVLKYLGPTEFATGMWAGIELEYPIGKNDGSVKGKRYFMCRDKHGLFAPSHKVSRSPSNRKPSTGLRRAGSRESMLSNVSNISSLTSSATPRNIRSVLKETEKHLEQVLKEREMDRNELAQMIAQKDQALKQIQALREENYELDRKFKECSKIEKEGESEIHTLRLALEEEHRKNEDILFSLEEIKIAKSELESQLNALEGVEAASENKNEHIKKAEGKIYDLEERVMVAEESLISKVMQIEELQKETAELKEKLSIEETTNIDRQTQIDAQDEKILRMESLMEAMKVENKDGLENQQASLNELGNLRKEVDALREENEALKEYRSTLAMQVVEAFKLKSGASSDLNQISLLPDSLKTQVSSVINENNIVSARLESDLSNLQTKIHELSNEILVKDEEFKSLSLKYSDMVQAQETSQLLQTEKVELKAKDDETKRSLAAIKEQEMAELISQLDALKIENQFRVELLEAVKAENESLLRNEEALKNRYEDRISSLSLQKDESLAAEITESDALRKQLKDLNNQLVIKASTNREISDALETMTASLADAQKDFKDLLSSSDAARISQSAMIDELTLKLKEVKSSKEKEIAELKYQQENNINELKKQKESNLDELKKQQENCFDELKKQQLSVIAELKTQQESDIAALVEKHMQEVSELKRQHEADIQQLLSSQSLTGSYSKEKITELEEYLEAAKDSLNVLQMKSDNMSSLYSNTVAQNTELNEALQNILAVVGASSVAEVSNEIISKNEKIAGQTEMLEKITEELNEKNASYINLEKELNVLESRLQTQYDLYESYKAEVKKTTDLTDAALKNSLNDQDFLNAKLKSLEEGSIKLKEEIESATNAREGLLLKIEELVIELIKKDDLLKAQESETSSSIASYEQIKQAYEIGEDEARKLRAEIGNVQEYCMKLEACLELREKEFKVVCEQNVELKAKVTEHNLKVLHLNACIDKVQEKCDELEKKKEKTILELEKHFQSMLTSVETSSSNMPASDLMDDSAEVTTECSSRDSPRTCGTIEFLNSIIADLKEKNSKLHDQLEIMYHSGGSWSLGQSVQNEKSSHAHGSMADARLYCDHCERFDSHSTENCEKRSRSPGGNVEKASGDHNRPYCTICECFGHTMNDCKDLDSF